MIGSLFNIFNDLIYSEKRGGGKKVPLRDTVSISIFFSENSTFLFNKGNVFNDTHVSKLLTLCFKGTIIMLVIHQKFQSSSNPAINAIFVFPIFHDYLIKQS